MKKTALSGLLILMIALVAMSGCGKKHDDSPSTTATIKILSQGTGTIGAITVTAVLPAGVTVKATPDSVNTAALVTDPGVVEVSGVAVGTNTLATGTYTVATASAPGKVMISMVSLGTNSNGFGPGEFVTVTCDIATGSSPKAEDFSVSDFIAKDLDGAEIATLTAGLTVDMH